MNGVKQWDLTTIGKLNGFDQELLATCSNIICRFESTGIHRYTHATRTNPSSTKSWMQSHGWHLAMVAMDQYGSFAKPIETTWT